MNLFHVLLFRYPLHVQCLRPPREERTDPKDIPDTTADSLSSFCQNHVPAKRIALHHQ